MNTPVRSIMNPMINNPVIGVFAPVSGNNGVPEVETMKSTACEKSPFVWSLFIKRARYECVPLLRSEGGTNDQYPNPFVLTTPVITFE